MSPKQLLFLLSSLTTLTTSTYDCKIKVIDYNSQVYSIVKCEALSNFLDDFDIEIELNKFNKKKKDCDAPYTTLKYKKMDQAWADRYNNMMDITFETDFRISCEWEEACVLVCRDLKGDLDLDDSGEFSSDEGLLI